MDNAGPWRETLLGTKQSLCQLLKTWGLGAFKWVFLRMSPAPVPVMLPPGAGHILWLVQARAERPSLCASVPDNFEGPPQLQRACSIAWGFYRDGAVVQFFLHLILFPSPQKPACQPPSLQSLLLWEHYLWCGSVKFSLRVYYAYV